MTQQDRDRLVALQKAKKGLITQKEAAAEIGQSERHVRRLLKRLKGKGDAVIVHGLRGRRSNRRIDEKVKQAALKILSDKVYAGFGPTLASEYLGVHHRIEVSRETLRAWMAEGKLWRPKRQRIEKIHEWRQRRSRVASWCSGTRANTPGWRFAAQSCI
jgi:DNA-binding Lrp family transcriptional regulator